MVAFQGMVLVGIIVEPHPPTPQRTLTDNIIYLYLLNTLFKCKAVGKHILETVVMTVKMTMCWNLLKVDYQLD